MVLSKAAFFAGLAQVLKKRYLRYIWTASMAYQYMRMTGRVGNDPTPLTPDLMIAGIPIWFVKHIGHASSDEIMKYRSMGGIFLAHQKGGRNTFKFTAHFFGPARYILTKILEFILDLGSESDRAITSLIPGQPITFLDPSGKYPDPKSLAATIRAPLVEYTTKDEFQNERYVYHRTFPITTQTKIYTDMYMETMVTRESTKFGIESIEVICAFRQFTPPTHFQKSIVDLGLGFVAKKKYYRTYVPKGQVNWLTRIDGIANAIWAQMQYISEMVWQRDQEWYKKQNGRLDYERNNIIKTFAAFSVYQSVKYGGF